MWNRTFRTVLRGNVVFVSGLIFHGRKTVFDRRTAAAVVVGAHVVRPIDSRHPVRRTVYVLQALAIESRRNGRQPRERDPVAAVTLALGVVRVRVPHVSPGERTVADDLRL